MYARAARRGVRGSMVGASTYSPIRLNTRPGAVLRYCYRTRASQALAKKQKTSPQ